MCFHGTVINTYLMIIAVAAWHTQCHNIHGLYRQRQVWSDSGREMQESWSECVVPDARF